MSASLPIAICKYFSYQSNSYLTIVFFLLDTIVSPSTNPLPFTYSTSCSHRSLSPHKFLSQSHVNCPLIVPDHYYCLPSINNVFPINPPLLRPSTIHATLESFRQFYPPYTISNTCNNSFSISYSLLHVIISYHNYPSLTLLFHPIPITLLSISQPHYNKSPFFIHLPHFHSQFFSFTSIMP